MAAWLSFTIVLAVLSLGFGTIAVLNASIEGYSKIFGWGILTVGGLSFIIAWLSIPGGLDLHHMILAFVEFYVWFREQV